PTEKPTLPEETEGASEGAPVARSGRMRRPLPETLPKMQRIVRALSVSQRCLDAVAVQREQHAHSLLTTQAWRPNRLYPVAEQSTAGPPEGARRPLPPSWRRFTGVFTLRPASYHSTSQEQGNVSAVYVCSRSLENLERAKG